MTGSRNSTFLSIFVLGVFALPLAAVADPLAILASARGEVAVRPAGGKSAEAAAFGRALERGDQVQVAQGGAATIVFNDGSVIELGAGSAITVGGKAQEKSRVETGTPIPDEVFSQVSKYVTGGSRQTGLVALSAMRSGKSASDSQPMIVSPRLSDVLTDRPALSWRAVDGANRYRVTLSGEDGEVWSQETAATELPYPADAEPLAAGGDYSWRVEARSDLGSLRSEESVFHVPTAETRDAVRRNLESIDKSAGGAQSPAACFLSGSYLFSRGLYGEAATQFESLSRLLPESPAPHEALGNVYRAVGLMDLAAAEFERALTLTRGN